MSSKPGCECLAPIIRRLEAGENPDLVVPMDISGLDPDCAAELAMMYIKYGGQTRKERSMELIRNAGR